MATKTTRKARAADLNDFNIGYLDEAGDGSGSFDALVALVDNAGALISSANPIPVQNSALTASGISPVTGAFTAAAQVSASFTPAAARNFNWTIWGTFVATVVLERSFDGSNWHPLTGAGTTISELTAPASETSNETEFGVEYRLRCSAFTSGTINYRISQ